MRENESFIELCKVMDILLGENGCPWDKVQTHQSLRPNLLEESYEAADAIDQEDMNALQEELGDVLLQVIMHSRIAEKNGHFTLANVIALAADKLVRRHTHIFGEDVATSPAEVEKTWEDNKNKEKEIFTPLENMQAVPQALPALARAQKVIKRSEKEFPDCVNEIKSRLDCLEETGTEEAKMEIHGEILLLVAALSTNLKLNAENSLTNAVRAYINSFE